MENCLIASITRFLSSINSKPLATAASSQFYYSFIVFFSPSARMKSLRELTCDQYMCIQSTNPEIVTRLEWSAWRIISWHSQGNPFPTWTPRIPAAHSTWIRRKGVYSNSRSHCPLARTMGAVFAIKGTWWGANGGGGGGGGGSHKKNAR